MVPQERVHSCCGIFLQGGDDMTVCVHREAYLREAEAFPRLAPATLHPHDRMPHVRTRVSIERLIRYLIALDRDVQIIVSPKPRTRARATVKVTGKSRSSRISDVACSE
jgi:hypothetical protein